MKEEQCVLVFFLKGAESKEEQPVGSDAAQQLSSSRCRALLHHHQPQPNGPWQEENLPPVVSYFLQLKQNSIYVLHLIFKKCNTQAALLKKQNKNKQ